MKITEVISCFSAGRTICAHAVENDLIRLGYSPSTIEIYLRTVHRFCDWVLSQKTVEFKSFEESIPLFLDQHLPVCRCNPLCPAPHITKAALRHFRRLANMNSSTGVLGSTGNPSPAQVELNSFDKYLNQVCGLSQATRISRRQFVGRFLREKCGDGPIDTGLFTPQSLMKYVSLQARGYKAGTISVMATSIRSYLKFLQFRGDIDSRLVRVIPSPPKWRLADYPTVISETQVEALLASFDNSNPSGIRDRAMAICMLQMGLRASEVADLDLEDVDWRKSTLCLRRGKSRVVRELPLMDSCGKAIARYLKYGRPQTGSRKVFVRHTTPVGAILGTENVRGAMRRAYERAGFPPNWTGTHILRHTAATRMLNGGASLKQVADVLGHQSIDTTTIYSKVNIRTLETVMQPWPVIPS